MTESASRDVAQDAIAITAETMGHDFLAALLTELRQMPDHWARLNEQRQQQIIDRLKDKVRAGIDQALTIFMRGEFPAVQADLKTIAWDSGIKATLAIPKDALYRHALCDAQGTKVLVVLTDANRWLSRMDEIKAKGDQIDLFDADYDPERDQPGYRRDKDRTAPAGPTWEDLKKSLKGKPVETPDPAKTGEDGPGQPETAPQVITGVEGNLLRTIEVQDGETWAAQPFEGLKAGQVFRFTGSTEVWKCLGDAYPIEGEPENFGVSCEPAPALIFGTAATEEQERTVKLRILQEQLASIGIGISLGALHAFSAEQITATSTWAEAYAAGPDSCKIARPLWLPIPDKGDKK